jgi:hypothetical protein
VLSQVFGVVQSQVYSAVQFQVNNAVFEHVYCVVRRQVRGFVRCNITIFCYLVMPDRAQPGRPVPQQQRGPLDLQHAKGPPTDVAGRQSRSFKGSASIRELDGLTEIVLSTAISNGSGHG